MEKESKEFERLSLEIDEMLKMFEHTNTINVLKYGHAMYDLGITRSHRLVDDFELVILRNRLYEYQAKGK